MRKSYSNISLTRFRTGGTSRKVLSGQRLSKGLSRLQTAATNMTAKELAELNELRKQKAPAAIIEKKLNRIRSLNERIEARMKHNLKQNTKLMTQDAEFPMLLNRESFFATLKKKLMTQGNHSLVYIDMDKLKKLNTLFGRAQGGMGFLTANAKAFSKVVTKLKGAAGHIGGDEFIFYLPMAPKNVESIMRSYLETVRKEEISKWKKAKAAGKINAYLSYSAGIIRLEKGVDPQRAERAADLLCMRAKRQGRGRITFSVRESVADFERELKLKK